MHRNIRERYSALAINSVDHILQHRCQHVPLNSCSRMVSQCCFRQPGNSDTFMPSIPGLPLLAFTRRKACWQFSRPQTSSVSYFVPAGLSVSQFAVYDSVLSRGALGASLLPSPVKASTLCSWFFCRLSFIESCVPLAAPYCLGLRPCGLPCPLLTPAPCSE